VTRRRAASPGTSRIRRVLTPLQEFINTEVLGGLALLSAAVLALAWANSPWDEQYFDLLSEHISVDGAVFHIDLSIQHWINDALMALFFFVVGLEIKRELVKGELKGFDRAALPAFAAVGGMLLPAAIFFAINAGGPAEHGWGIPMATDIAFALGLLALLGSRISPQLRVFLLALAIVDDIGAIIVIAVFYTGEIQLDSLAIAGAIFALIYAMRLARVTNFGPYIVLGICAWIAVYESGIHATIAGVVLGLMTPAHPLSGGETKAPLDRLEHFLHPYTSYLIIPLFALANAGVALTPSRLDDSLSSAATLGIIAGLVIGKPVGILAATALAVRLRIATLPRNTTWPEVAGVGVLAGVGFTVALFINELAFESATLIERGKIGILTASLCAATLGLIALLLVSGPEEPEEDT
jgi:NhaA family Na+:H+ antiporter